MATRTHVTIHAEVGISEDEACVALSPLVKGFGPVELWRSAGWSDPERGTPKTFFLSLDADRKEEVEELLRTTTQLPVTVEVIEDWQLS